MIAVYHNRNFLMFPFEEHPFDLVPVAYVDTDNLEDAFKLTNTIDSHWSKNDFNWIHERAQIPCRENVDYCRSTSVGDVLYKMESPDEWIGYQVDSVGFSPLPKCANIYWNT